MNNKNEQEKINNVFCDTDSDSDDWSNFDDSEWEDMMNKTNNIMDEALKLYKIKKLKKRNNNINKSKFENKIRLATDVFSKETNKDLAERLNNNYIYDNTKKIYYTKSIKKYVFGVDDNIKYAVRDSYVNYYMSKIINILNKNKISNKKIYFKVGLFINDKVYYLYFKQYDFFNSSELFFNAISDKLKKVLGNTKYFDYDFLPCHYVNCETKHIKYYIDWVRADVITKQHKKFNIPVFPKNKIDENKKVVNELSKNNVLYNVY